MNSKAFKFLGFLVLVVLVILFSVAETRDIEKKGKGSNPQEDQKSRRYCYRGCCVRGLLGRCKNCCIYDGQPQIIVADDDQPMPHHKGSEGTATTRTDATTEEVNHGGGGHGGGKDGSGGHGDNGGGKGVGGVN